MKRAIWSEFLPWHWVEADLLRLSAAGLQLNLALPAQAFPDPALAQLLRAAAAQNVPVGAWLLLPDRQGYWPNAENAQEFSQWVQVFLDWLEQQHLQVSELIVDLETPLALSRFMKGNLLRGLQLEWQRCLSAHNHEQFLSATALFSDLVQQVHQVGLKIQAVTYPFVVHDAQVGNTAFQELLQIPVTPVPWDRISLMVYRSSFQDLWPWPLSSWLVGHYISTARQAFSQPVVAALGVIGSIGKLSESGFRDPDQIGRDLAAAKAAGAAGIELFSLDGMHQLGAPLDWLRLFQTPPAQTEATLGDKLLLQSLNQSHRMLTGLYRRFWARSKSERPPSPLLAPDPNAPAPQKACADPEPSSN